MLRFNLNLTIHIFNISATFIYIDIAVLSLVRGFLVVSDPNSGFNLNPGLNRVSCLGNTECTELDTVQRNTI